MADYSQYPDWQVVEDVLKSASYYPTSDEQIARARGIADDTAKAAIAEWENRTSYYPFLSTDATPETRILTVNAKEFYQTGVLQLRGGIVDAETASIMINGQAVTADRYELMPANTQGGRKPHFWVRFYGSCGWGGYSVFRRPLRITVTGRWGYCTTLPGDVWEQLKQKATLQTLIEIENLQNLGSISVDGASKTLDVVGVIDQKTILLNWSKDFDKYIEHYKLRI